MTTTCSICNLPYDGAGNLARPLCEQPCCDACHDAIVAPLRAGRVIARDGALQVAAFAVMLARQRARLAPVGTGALKDMALLAAQALVSNAVERLLAVDLKSVPLHRKGPNHVS